MGNENTLGQLVHELQTTAGLPRSVPRLDRLQRSFIGHRAASIEVTRTIEAPVALVTAALARVAPRSPYFLELKTFTGSLTAGGIAGFRMPTSAAAIVASPWAASGVRALDVEFTANSSESTQLVVRLPLDEVAVGFSRVSATTSVLGSAVAGSVAVAFAKGAVAVSLLGLPFALGFGLALPMAAALSSLVWRRREAHLRTILVDMADAIALDVRLGGAFGAPALPALPALADDGAAFVALVG